MYRDIILKIYINIHIPLIMIRKDIVKIIEESGYIIDNSLSKIAENSKLKNDPESYKSLVELYSKEISFENTFENDAIKKMRPKLSFHCDLKRLDPIESMDMRIVVILDNYNLRQIKSPTEGIEAFNWLNMTNDRITKLHYKGVFNVREKVFAYIYKTNAKDLEKFQKIITDFKNAYLTQ